MKSIKQFGWVLVVFSIVALLFVGVGGYVANYQYENKIGAYMENAYYMNTPQRMVEQLELAKQGMRDAVARLIDTYLDKKKEVKDE